MQNCYMNNKWKILKHARLKLNVYVDKVTFTHEVKFRIFRLIKVHIFGRKTMEATAYSNWETLLRV